jgi:hypothetical protein
LSQIRAALRKGWRYLSRWSAFRWNQVRQVGEILRRVSFGIFVIVITSLGLLIVPQGREIAMRAGESGIDVWIWLIATGLLAAQVWYWSHQLLSSRYVPDDEDQGTGSENQEPVYSFVPETAVLYGGVRSLPRWLSCISILVPLSAVVWMWWNDHYKASHGEGVLLALLGLFLVAVTLVTRLEPRFDFTGSSPKAEMLRVRIRRIAYAISSIQVVGLVTWAVTDPHSMGDILGAGPVLLLGLASLVPAGSFVLGVGMKVGFPALSSMCIVALLLSSSGKGYVRQMEHRGNDARPTLSNAFDAWLAAQEPGKRPTMVVVATAGGGITAAYWAATVLESIRDMDADIQKKLFVISGVSGGAVGSALFAEGLRCHQPRSVLPVLGGDLLSPTLSTLLFHDMLYWFSPVAVLSRWKDSDRAITFERQLERLWQDKFACAGTSLERPFFSRDMPKDGQSASTAWTPILMLNSTHEQTGRLVVMSQVQLLMSNAPTTGYFESAIDYYAMTNADIRTSSAALNSARFPYISPMGEFRFSPATGFTFAGHVGDGGYFNNDGATTLLKVLRSIEPQLDQVDVVVVQISIDEPVRQDSTTPGLLADQVARSGDRANELVGPLKTVISVRGGHGEDARNELLQWARRRADTGTSYFHYRMLTPTREALAKKYSNEKRTPVRPPLGWVLSPASQYQIAKDTLCLEGNFSQWRDMVDVLHGVAAIERCGFEAQALAPGMTPPLPDALIVNPQLQTDP